MIPQEQRFRFNDGTSVGNLEELEKVLMHISEEEFRHHVSNDKNDFANWIKYVLKKESLASKVWQAKTKTELSGIINDDLRSIFIDEAPTQTIKHDRGSEQTEKNILHEIKKAEHVMNDIKKDEQKQMRDIHSMKFIVKEFVYGMVFGLILGLIIAGVISNLV